MVKGLEIFRERFRDFDGAFTLIGGAACDEWFAGQGLAFRATKDLDLVLMIEVLDRKFVASLRAFVTNPPLPRGIASGYPADLFDGKESPAVPLI